MTARVDSWQLIKRGTAEEFVNALIREAQEHPAVHHRYLQRLAAGDVPDMLEALRDYAFQYSYYGAEFASYVEGVLGGLKSPAHRSALLENLAEEKGNPDAENIDEMPHPKIFAIFRHAIGIDEDYEAHNSPCTTVLVWRDLFLQKCQSRQEGVGVGAMGIGTEMVVPTMYRYLIRGIQENTDLSERDYRFFTLHVDCDSEHAQDLVDMTIDLCLDHDVREAVRFGVFSSLNLRKAFWDIMLGRATSMSRSN